MLSTLAGCGKQESPPTGPRQNVAPRNRVAEIQNDPKLNSSQRALLLWAVPHDQATKERRIKDRKELVLPPPPGWHPEDTKYKVKLTLIPESTKIRAGQKFRYRLETQNTGREHLYFHETPSFTKTGCLEGDYHFHVAPPGDVAQRIGVPRWGAETDETEPPRNAPPAVMTKEEKELAMWRETTEGILSLDLESGETLSTRGDSPDTRFRNLRTGFEFSKPGVYRIYVEYDDLGKHPDVEREEFLKKEEQAFHVSREELLKSNERIRIKQGISLEQQERRRTEEVTAHEERKLKSVGRTTSNMVTIEVIP